MLKFGFDFAGSLYSNSHLRELARRVHTAGHEVHLIPALGEDSDLPYEQWCMAAGVPFTEVHRIFHPTVCELQFVANLKVEKMKEIGCHILFDDNPVNIEAVRKAGMKGVLVAGDEPIDFELGGES